jgi:hypothetical protein
LNKSWGNYISFVSKLNQAISLITAELITHISSIHHNPVKPVVQLEFISGLVIYIRYNEFDEYSYQIQFSNRKLDRIRYDNYDDKWDVSTKPNHLHPRFQNDAQQSDMIGDPIVDIPKLIDIIKELI